MNLDRAFLVGEGIYLRPLDMDDLEGDYIQWVNEERTVRYMDIKFPTTRDGLKSFLEAKLGSKETTFFAIVEKETGNHIGNVKLGPIDWINRHAIYGRLIGAKDTRGKGYGTEVVRLVLRYAFEVINLHKVFAAVSVDNKAAIRSNEKAGLKIEGTLREHKFEEGVYKNLHFMGITKDDYMAAKRESSAK